MPLVQTLPLHIRQSLCCGSVCEDLPRVPSLPFPSVLINLFEHWWVWPVDLAGKPAIPVLAFTSMPAFSEQKTTPSLVVAVCLRLWQMLTHVALKVQCDNMGHRSISKETNLAPEIKSLERFESLATCWKSLSCMNLESAPVGLRSKCSSREEKHSQNPGPSSQWQDSGSRWRVPLIALFLGSLDYWSRLMVHDPSGGWCPEQRTVQMKSILSPCGCFFSKILGNGSYLLTWLNGAMVITLSRNCTCWFSNLIEINLVFPILNLSPGRHNCPCLSEKIHSCTKSTPRDRSLTLTHWKEEEIQFK